MSLVSINSYQQLSSLVSPISPLSSIWQRFYFKLVCVCACSHACTCSHVQESCKARRSLVAGVTGGCEPACVCVGNGTWVLHKSKPWAMRTAVLYLLSSYPWVPCVYAWSYSLLIHVCLGHQPRLLVFWGKYSSLTSTPNTKLNFYQSTRKVNSEILSIYHWKLAF